LHCLPLHSLPLLSLPTTACTVIACTAQFVYVQFYSPSSGVFVSRLVDKLEGCCESRAQPLVFVWQNVFWRHGPKGELLPH